MARVVVSAPLPGDAVARIAARHDVEVGADPTGMPRDELLERVRGADALVALLTNRIDAELLEAGPSLRVVANCAVGVDNVDLAACRARRVVVTNTPDVLTEATADLTFGLLLAACRRIAEGDRFLRHQAAGGPRWRGWAPTEWIGAPVHGSVLGILGLGRIGRAVARRAAGFAMTVLYAQRHAAPAAVEAALGARRVTVDELFTDSDVVCVCCPLTDETRGIASRERIDHMKPGAFLVNTARGPCVDEIALADALEACRLGGAALDVFTGEPAIAPRLLACERLVVTPHLASGDRATRAAMAGLCADAVLAVLAGEAPRIRVV
jgi:glyoxylate reductase